MLPQTQARKKRNSSKVNLLISFIFHAVIVLVMLYFAARQGWFGKQMQEHFRRNGEGKAAGETPEPEKPKVEPPKVGDPETGGSGQTGGSAESPLRRLRRRLPLRHPPRKCRRLILTAARRSSAATPCRFTRGAGIRFSLQMEPSRQHGR